ncbi:MAG: aspartate kinase [Flavobacteriaceae bacterium]|nr:aspartate kinase [Flavobacteriaceae bacterium]
MKIFKFGGASVKDAESIKSLVEVLIHEQEENLIIVISAMGKMTNAFEKIVNALFFNKNELERSVSDVKNYHSKIVFGLFGDSNTEIFKEIEVEYEGLENFIEENKKDDFDFVYDQIVSLGELISTKIVSAYLNKVGIKNTWLDARKLIATDAFYREAKVDWKSTKEKISKAVSKKEISITQGFIGGCNDKVTTLGREGSDFSAAIFAYCLNAQSVTIWKDVQGVLNADPSCFKETVMLQQISYKEAIEMAYYGASVIHPKTLKPLENKLIPLRVRSFYDLNNEGTIIQKGKKLVPKVPCFILKNQQILVSISALDFSFMVEHHLSQVFQKLHDYKLKVNLIQNSALSFSVCIEDKFDNFLSFYEELKSTYKISYNTDLTLYTIRHFDKASIERVVNEKKVFLKQSSRETIQIITE